MKSFSGIGTGITENAIKQATLGLTDPKAIVVFASIESIEEASELLMKEYPNADVLGVMGSTYNNGKVIDSSNFLGKEDRNIIQVLALFDDAEVACGVLDRLDDAPLYRIKEFNDNLNKVNPNSENTICIAFSTDYEESFVSTVKTILESKKIDLVGGSISGAFGKDVETFVLLNGKKYIHATGYMIIKNKVGKVKKYRNDTYVKKSGEIMQITKVGGGKAQRRIIEVDGKRLDRFYMEKYNYNEKDFQEKVFLISTKTPIAVVTGENTYVCAIKCFNQDGSVDVFKKVYEGGSLVFMQMGDWAAMESELIKKIKNDLKNVSFIFTIDCLYRHLIYSDNGFIDTYLNGVNSIGSHVGYIGLGEQDVQQHFSQTMVCVAFE